MASRILPSKFILCAVSVVSVLQIVKTQYSYRCGIVNTNCSLYENAKYQRIDGACNNLKHPGWGTPNSTYERVIPANYPYGWGQALNGSKFRRPSARNITLNLFPDRRVIDAVFSLSMMQYGQVISHDMAFLLLSDFNDSCCVNNQIQKGRSNCSDILIGPDDPGYGRYNISCTLFVRTVTNVDLGCIDKSGRVEQINEETAYLDASLIYGFSPAIEATVRAYIGGRLRTRMVNGRAFPPQDKVVDDQLCAITPRNKVCYLGGDARNGQNPQLSVFAVLWLRQHNRIADELKQLNPHWKDEKLYQETRRIVIALHTHIIYYWWLPALLGRDILLKRKIIYNTNGYVNDYDENVNPGTINSQVTAALRLYHSAVAGDLKLIKANYTYKKTLALKDCYLQPGIIEQDDNFDDLIRSLAYQNKMMADQFYTSDLTDHLFPTLYFPHGNDLRAITTQRNRDHGIASYNDFRAYCGFSRAKCFEDFYPLISKGNIAKLKRLYANPDDVELSVGGTLEENVHGAQAGAVYSCLNLEQFHRSRISNRYFYESGTSPGKFDLPQLNEIRKMSPSLLVCESGDNITHIQRNLFWLPNKTNTIVSCSLIPKINLTFWKENTK